MNYINACNENYLKFINITRNPSKVKLIVRPVYREGDQFSFLQNQCMMTRGLDVAQSYDSPKEVLSSLIFLKRLIRNRQNLFIYVMTQLIVKDIGITTIFHIHT